MINFDPNEEQSMLVEAISRFGKEKVAKVYREADESGALPAEVVKGGWEIGVLPASLPDAYGGFGAYSAVTGALAMEAFAEADLSTSLVIGAPSLIAIPVLLCGTEEQKSNLLPIFCEELIPRFSSALTEPSIFFDPRSLKTTASREGEEYIISGVKAAVPLADSAEQFLVYASENGETQAFLLPADGEGVTVGEREKLMGLKALPTFGLTLDNCRVPAKNRLGGEEGIDFGLLLNHMHVAQGAAAVGMAKASYEYALDYAKLRVQFDEPIAHRQSIAFMLAEMATDVDASRLMVWEAAWQLDQGVDATQSAALMKFQVDEMVMSVTDRALQTLGGHGYIREYPVELWFRNARAFAALSGLAVV